MIAIAIAIISILAAASDPSHRRGTLASSVRAVHGSQDDCESDFSAPFRAYPAQFSPSLPGPLGRTIVRFRLSNQRAAVHQDFGRALWKLEIRGPEPRQDLVHAATGYARIEEQGFAQLEQEWNGRDGAGRPVQAGTYAATVKARFLPDRIGALRPARGYDEVGTDLALEEATTSTQEILVRDVMPPRLAQGFAVPQRQSACQIQQNAPLAAGWPWNYYYGSTHSHSTWSDGGLSLGPTCKAFQNGVGPYDPAAIFTYARNTAGMDYWVVNEHNHLMEDALANSTGAAPAPEAVRARYQAGLEAARAATVDDAFVAIYGMEWGEIASGGHVTLLETPKLFGWECAPGCTPPTCLSSCFFDVFTDQNDYLGLYAQSVQNPSPLGPLGILAHPQNTDFMDFAFDANARQAIQGLAVRSGLAFTNDESCSDANVGSTDFVPRWREALSKGFKVAPTADHDAHCATWGTGLPNRTVYVLRNDIGAPILSKKRLLQAHRARHFFASEDSNAQITFGTADGARIMGDEVTAGDSVTLTGSHFDPDGDGIGSIRVHRGTGTTVTATPYKTFTNVSSFTLTERVAAGNVVAGNTYWYYVRFTQNDAALQDIFSAPIWVTYGSSCLPAATVTPTEVAFGDQRTSTTSPSRAAALRNGDCGALDVTGYTLSGSQASDFAVDPAPDIVSLAAGAPLEVSVRFTPSAMGQRSASVVFHTAAGDRVVALSGTGVEPVATLSATAMDFGNVRRSTTSDARHVVLKNDGTAPLKVSGWSISGAAASDFAAGPSSAAVEVAAGASLDLGVTFSPAANGSRTATLTIATELGIRTVSLSGVGIFPATSVTPEVIAFGEQRTGIASATHTVTVRNTGTDVLHVSPWQLTVGAADFLITPAAAALSLGVGGSATFSVEFLPATTGPISATLTFSGDDATKTVALSGTGVAPLATLSATTLAFGNVRKSTTSGAKHVLLSNEGSAPLQVSGWSLDGTGALDFAVAPASGPVEVAVGKNLDLGVTFAPAATGGREARLTISTELGDRTVSLSGAGVFPATSVSPEEITFGQQRTGVASAPQTVTVTNSGMDVLNLAAWQLGGDAADFLITPAAAPLSLGVGESAEFDVVFLPAATGPSSATLTFAGDDAEKSVALSGIGIAPAAKFSAKRLDFGTVLRGTPAAPLSVVISNTGSADLELDGGRLTGPDLRDFGFSLPDRDTLVVPGASVTCSVTFTPTGPGPREATLRLRTDGGDQEVALSGTGLTRAAVTSVDELTFGTAVLGQPTSALAVSLQNTGTAPLDVAGWSVTGSAAAEFHVEPTSTAFTLPAGQERAFTVSFQPAQPGQRTATLSFDTAAGPLSVSLRGEGQPDQKSVQISGMGGGCATGPGTPASLLWLAAALIGAWKARRQRPT